MYAAQNGHEAVLASVLDAGANKEAKENGGFTPLSGRYNVLADACCTGRSRGGGSFSTGCGSEQGGEG